jgi:hypothetical protein
MEDGNKESFGSKLKIIIPFGFPPGIDPFDEILLRGP